ncbi:MAG TPA: rod shape-determining protein MreC [Steroidobacteraceae bacterium]|nr:rod shape-determining protein MreC [Steroidobacteraceae bacterium]
MAAFGAGAYRSSPGRGPAPGFRFTLYAILAILLMFFDQRRGWLEQARYFLSAAAYPLQLAVSSPSAAWHWLEDVSRTRETLRLENRALREQERALEVKTLRYEALARENGELRGLRDALPPVADHWLVAEVVDVELNNLQQRLLINRGARNGVFKGQAVMDSHGLLGQTVHVGPWSAEIILVTDPEGAVPVQIDRTGVRTIAVGAGDSELLALPYLPANADVKVGDLLITSGLGGVYPQGYPVGRVIEVRRDAVQPLAQIRAAPLARLDQLREVMLVWFRSDHPASPNQREGSGDLARGNPTLLPQTVPPRPKPPATQASTQVSAQAGTAAAAAREPASGAAARVRAAAIANRPSVAAGAAVGTAAAPRTRPSDAVLTAPRSSRAPGSAAASSTSASGSSGGGGDASGTPTPAGNGSSSSSSAASSQTSGLATGSRR